MSNSLLDRSLDDISRQQSSHGRRGGRGAGVGGRGNRDYSGSGSGSGSGNGRSSPYSKPSRRADYDDGAAAPAGPDGAWKHDLFKTDKLDYGGEGDEDGNASGPRPSRRAAPARGGEPRSTRLKVTNLHYEVSEAELEALFVQIGPLAPGSERESNPAIKFDFSGRSLGEAYVTYESEADAARAKEVFHDALAKGERIALEYDFRGPPRPRRTDGATGSSWKSGPSSFGGGSIDVLAGGAKGANSLLARLDRSQVPVQAARGDNSRSNGAGFVSSIGRAAGSGSGSHAASERGRGAPRTAPRGAVPRGGGRGGRDADRERGGRSQGQGRERTAKTAEDLDRELDDFMAAGNAGGSTAAAGAEDVDMA